MYDVLAQVPKDDEKLPQNPRVSMRENEQGVRRLMDPQRVGLRLIRNVHVMEENERFRPIVRVWWHVLLCLFIMFI